MFLDEDPRDFPTAADEPVFEALPDYTLRVEDDDVPLYVTGENALAVNESTDEALFDETSLDETQLAMLEGLLAKARRLKFGRVVPPGSATGKASEIAANSARTVSHETERKTVSSGSTIEFDFAQPASLSPPAESAPNPVKPPQPTPEAPVRQVSGAPKKRPRKACPGCTTRLPVSARFCYECGLPQPLEETPPVGQRATPPNAVPAPLKSQTPAIEVDGNDTLELPPLPGNTTLADSKITPTDKSSSSPRSGADQPSGQKFDLAGLKQDFRVYLEDRIRAYFGEDKIKRYLDLLAESNDFQLVRDGSLRNLATWANEQDDPRRVQTRQRNTLADLAEYFIVETAAELHGKRFPQRLLRYQSVDWEEVDLFRMIMDYLDFTRETEAVYTDFVTMPPRALKNAGKSFLHATKEERIFFICDQSLISQAKNGFAMTDAAIYWKNLLQPAGTAIYTTMDPPKIENGHLTINGQFFDAGGNLNVKLALLLDKLRRMPQ